MICAALKTILVVRLVVANVDEQRARSHRCNRDDRGTQQHDAEGERPTGRDLPAVAEPEPLGSCLADEQQATEDGDVDALSTAERCRRSLERRPGPSSATATSSDRGDIDIDEPVLRILVDRAVGHGGVP